MYEGELETKIQTLLICLEAVAYLALAVWCLGRGREGTWARAGAIGAVLVGIALGVSAAASFQVVFLESSSIFEQVFFHAHVQAAFTIGRVAGVLLLVTGFVLSRRTPPAPTASVYGSPSS